MNFKKIFFSKLLLLALIVVNCCFVGISIHETKAVSAKSLCNKLGVRSFGFVVKHNDPKADKIALELAHFLVDKGYTIIFADESQTLPQKFKAAVKEDLKSLVKIEAKEILVEKSDLVVVLGGDGTLLSVARLMKKKSIPVLGINLGYLGFLTATQPEQALEIIQKIINGKMPPISERMLLHAVLKRNNQTIFEGLAVNDAVISKGAISRIIGMNVTVDDNDAYKVEGDGLIVSTPTGSTAYSLSAGGPIVYPSMPALILTSICPHSLSQRPLILPEDSEIKIQLTKRPGHVYVTLDGQDTIDMLEGDVLIVRRFKDQKLKLIVNPKCDYFSLLREKLSFG